MAGKALASYLLSKGKSQKEIEKILNLSYKRVRVLILAAKSNTDNNAYPVLSSTLEKFCDNTDVNPYELYEIITNRKYCDTPGTIIANKDKRIAELEDRIKKEEDQVLFLRDMIKFLKKGESCGNDCA
jgi:hypothetical protein